MYAAESGEKEEKHPRLIQPEPFQRRPYDTCGIRANARPRMPHDFGFREGLHVLVECVEIGGRFPRGTGWGKGAVQVLPRNFHRMGHRGSTILVLRPDIQNQGLISASIFVAITIIGIVLCYRANRRGDNTDFIGRMICLSWPIGIKLGVVFLTIGLSSSPWSKFLCSWHLEANSFPKRAT
jgi:hypothetical protein